MGDDLTGSDGVGPVAPGDLRVSDAERQAVVDILREHTGAGRIQLDEFEERTGRAFAARTRRELDLLLRDLPGSGPWGAGAQGRPGAPRPAVPPGPSGVPAAGPAWPVHDDSPRPSGWAPTPPWAAPVGGPDRQQGFGQLRHGHHGHGHHGHGGRSRRHGRRGGYPLGTGLAGRAGFSEWFVKLAVLLTGIWALTDVSSGHILYFWPVWPLGSMALFAGGWRPRRRGHARALPQESA